MTKPIIFDDVEGWVVNTLRDDLPTYIDNSVYVGVLVPSSRPSEFVTVRQDGGSVQDHVISRPRVSVNVWGSSEQGATQLALVVSAILRSAADGNPVTNVSQIGGPSTITDEQPRRLLVFELTMRGRFLEALSP